MDTEKKVPARASWIATVSEADATGRVRELYEHEWDKTHQLVDNIFKVHSANPEIGFAHSALYRAVMYGKSGITRPEREMIGVVVSAINKCHY